MPNSVLITKGAKDWQIFQQEEGVTSIHIEGTYTKIEDSNNLIWGRIVSETSQIAVVDWRTATLTGDDCFEMTIENVPAGGLYRIETCQSPDINGVEWGLRGDFIFHIGVGDLYVIAGQSNSAGYGRTPINDPPEIGIHLYKNSENWDLATHPMNNSTNSVHEVNAEIANSGHSPYLSFAKKLKEHLNYPIGLIQTSLGGSPLSSWNPEENGPLYENMIKVVANCTNNNNKIAGVLWYQGCSDCFENLANTYASRFNVMVESMRKEFHNKKLPIYTVQLNKYVVGPNAEQDLYWSEIREIQRMAAKINKYVYVVPTMDLGLSDVIHNNSSANMVIGERLAYIALCETFKKTVHGKAPDIESAREVNKKQIKLTFSNVYQAIVSFELPVKDLQFEVSDEIGSVEITSYEFKANTIDLFLSREIGKNANVSFAAKTNPKPTIPFDSGSGLPLLGFHKFNIKNDIFK